jgi:hypothetical protein
MAGLRPQTCRYEDLHRFSKADITATTLKVTGDPKPEKLVMGKVPL